MKKSDNPGGGGFFDSHCLMLTACSEMCRFLGCAKISYGVFAIFTEQNMK